MNVAAAVFDELDRRYVVQAAKSYARTPANVRKKLTEKLRTTAARPVLFAIVDSLAKMTCRRSGATGKLRTVRLRSMNQV